MYSNFNPCGCADTWTARVGSLFLNIAVFVMARAAGRSNPNAPP